MAFTKKGLAYLSLAYCFVAIAIVFREFYLATYVIPIGLLFLVSNSLTSADLSGLKIQRKLDPSRTFGGDPINVTIRATNDTRRHLKDIEVEDRVPFPLISEGGLNSVPLSLRPGETIEWTYRISSAKRGYYVVGPISIRYADMLGFYRRRTQRMEQDSFAVLPSIEKMGTLDLRARRVGAWSGQVPSRRVGSGTEFYELRLYNAGDELRRINWKASARAGRLVTNEFESEHVTDVLIIVDSTEDVTSSIFEFDLTEFQLTLAGSLSSQLLLQGNRVGLAIYGGVRAWVDLAFGKRQLIRILDNLAMVKAGPALLPMSYAVESVVVSLMRSKSLIIFISPLLNENTANVISSLAEKGYVVICFTSALEHVTGTDPKALAVRILSAQRHANAIRVDSVATLVEFAPDVSLRSQLRRQTRIG
jgi:uncharacterized protein (DUF58 family)